MKRIIISGGGTGGHIFPAVSIANSLKKRISDIEILFVGAEGMMEMEKVPAAGYNIIGLPVAGLHRTRPFKNLSLPLKLFRSLNLASDILKKFKPDAVVGVGGYASAPMLWQAQKMKIPTLIQEQNSYAGLTNRILSKKAKTICVAYPDMERFFRKEKICFTGNPVRRDLFNVNEIRENAMKRFGFDAAKPVVLVLGGSLGARTLNESIAENLYKFTEKNIQLVWQTGKSGYQKALQTVETGSKNVKVFDFIYDMNFAFAAADIIVSRAGAGTISELCIVGKPVILVPSPNVSEDHQTKNAMALVKKEAALTIADEKARKELTVKIIELINEPAAREKLGKNISQLAMPDAAENIVNKILALIE
ncbi:MAG: undecaprenyldiphospho-muramoylpentapeptide beta-N-acetylglucosaminyltransferase [Prevotellaceae bacterium]|jgi:UDP-N-acetylglucosamine--N-acetylmuramyl-(pentapeptide) pyrophosphoryl-undecaprenol N-acetylglucosamine transferase|nr:undecaprenyldiphospho-muramoylpentapeptide beta-N-acetylglucosaminyltransferase [Prevotellaceae bacterium]